MLLVSTADAPVRAATAPAAICLHCHARAASTHCIVSSRQAVQTIQHPSSLWAVAALENGDFVTACQDHHARVFTRVPDMAAAADVAQAFEVRREGCA
jgi:hypothetical protein